MTYEPTDEAVKKLALIIAKATNWIGWEDYIEEYYPEAREILKMIHADLATFFPIKGLEEEGIDYEMKLCVTTHD